MVDSQNEMPMHVVVDGSNLATEGRTLPSLQQLIEGVIDFRTENPDTEVVVVVDATFGHRIDPSELPLFEDAIVHQEIVSPPAGAIGRGDAFVLRIAEKVGAVVLSNDSFQEFHAEHEWLFDKGRLIGGKPVPGVGWIFTPRTPVRGPKSREVTSEAKRKQRKTKVSAEAPLVTGAELLEKGKAALDKLPKGRREKAKKDEPKSREPKKDDDGAEAKDGSRDRRRSGDQAEGGEPRRSRRGRGPVEDAIAMATVEAVVPSPEDGEDSREGGKRRKRRRKLAPPAEPVNEPGVFLQLVASHRPGEIVEGEVETFSSHGAFVTVEDVRCYIPLTLLGDPAPRAARDVLKRGEVRSFVLRAFDAARRGVELALPGVDLPVGPVTDETAAAAVGAEAPEDDLAPAPPAKPRRAKKAAATAEPPVPVPSAAPRRNRRSAVPAEAALLPAGDPPPPDAAPAPRKRGTKKKAAAVEVESALPVTVEAAPEPAAAKRGRKKAAAAVAEEVAPEPPPAPRPRGSRKATPAAGLPAATLLPDPAPGRKRAAKKAAAAIEVPAPPPVSPDPEPTTPPRKRGAKKAAAPEAAATPPAAPARKRAAKTPAAPVVEVAPDPAPAKPRKRAARKAPPPDPAPAAPAAKAPAKRSPRKKAADPS